MHVKHQSKILTEKEWLEKNFSCANDIDVGDSLAVHHWLPTREMSSYHKCTGPSDYKSLIPESLLTCWKCGITVDSAAIIVSIHLKKN